MRLLVPLILVKHLKLESLLIAGSNFEHNHTMDI